ncbi:Na+/H+ antiporter NhaC [Bacillus sp. FJAT-29937]|uniref:Na+/H+ antiporter NhaC n=1 Tax=Bacillus sp. FJAT-29937 TaxID=1720553 RepID=UPI0009EB6941|nr:Na+/H+ antiporter NhaC [Bacillus sp. FJAT-29937]
MERKLPSFRISIIIICLMIVTMAVSVFIFDIPIHITLLLVITFSVLLLLLEGIKWQDIMSAIEDAGKLALPPLLILYVIGALIGTWIASGTVPMIIYWGLELIHPSIFLVTAVLVTSIVSVASGSSWSTAGTIGVALMGVGGVLGLNPAITAGAIISGSYVGDKMSPMSDTTNLAPAVAEADLFDHIKAMVTTALPGFLITLIIFLILGFNQTSNVKLDSINNIMGSLDETFNLSIITLIPPLIVLLFAIKKVPSLITLITSAIVAALIAIFMQGQSIMTITTIMDSGYVANTGIKEVDSLLSRGGFQSMNWTSSLAMLGIILGTILEKTGVLEVLLSKLFRLTKTVGGLVSTTVLSVVGLNMITASQYTSIVIGGRMFITGYKKKNMLPQTLSRTLEDSGTITSPLVPWNTCGVFMAGTLGVSTMAYAPYAIFCWTVPIIAIIYGFTNKFQWKTGEIESKKVYDIGA